MMKSRYSSILIAAGIFLLGTATGLLAQAYSDSPQRVEQKRAELSGAPNMEVIVSTAEYKPGDAIGRHFHHGLEAAYVIQGAQLQVPGKDAMSLAAGASMLNLREVKHGGFTVVGETSLKLFTVHIVDKNAPLYEYAE